jgi:hypothetical protein
MKKGGRIVSVGVAAAILFLISLGSASALSVTAYREAVIYGIWDGSDSSRDLGYLYLLVPVYNDENSLVAIASQDTTITLDNSSRLTASGSGYTYSSAGETSTSSLMVDLVMNHDASISLSGRYSTSEQGASMFESYLWDKGAGEQATFDNSLMYRREGGIGLSSSGSFSYEGALSAGHEYRFYVTGTGVNEGQGLWWLDSFDLQEEVPAAVPLPAAGVLFGFGLMGVAGIRRFKRQSFSRK